MDGSVFEAFVSGTLMPGSFRVMLSPETTKTLPSGSAVAVGYQRVDAHVRPARPGALLRVVDVGVLDAEVGVLVSAEDQQPPVGAGDLAGAEEVAPGRDSDERSGARIPHPLGVERRLEAVPRGHAAVRGQREVHGNDRPRLWRRERADHVGAGSGGGSGVPGTTERPMSAPISAGSERGCRPGSRR